MFTVADCMKTGIRTLPMQISKALCEVKGELRTMGIGEFVNEELSKPSMHMLRRPGKLFRPVLVFASAMALGKNVKDYVDLAVAIELLHTSSLVHDDMIDRDEYRRGIPSVHSKYGDGAAILAGDALISQAVHKCSQYEAATTDEISRCAMEMCAGEMLDYKHQSEKRVPNVKSYEEIARLKSGALIATSASIVAMRCKSKFYKNLRSFGSSMGVGFQIRDDVSDAVLDSKKSMEVFRPNIINTLMKYERLSKRKAIEKAVGMNHKYVDTATSQLNGTNSFALLRKYAQMVKVEEF